MRLASRDISEAVIGDLSCVQTELYLTVAWLVLSEH